MLDEDIRKTSLFFAINAIIAEIEKAARGLERDFS
jgi:hypothetical protein